MIPLKKSLSVLSLALIIRSTGVRAHSTILTGEDLPAIDVKVKALLHQRSFLL